MLKPAPPAIIFGMKFLVEVMFDDDGRLTDVVLTYPDARKPRLAAAEAELMRGLKHVLGEMADDILAEVGVQHYLGRRMADDVERGLRGE